MTTLFFLAVSFAVPVGDGHTRMGPWLEVLADPQRTLRIEDVQSSQFLPLGSTARGWGYTQAAYWARFELVNPRGEPVVAVLELSDAVGRADLFLVGDGGAISTRRSGNELPFSLREVESRNISFRIPLAASERKLGFVRVQSQGVLQLQPRLWNERGFVHREVEVRLLIGLQYGLLLGLCAYNLFLFFSIRDRVYLFYALFQLAVIGSQAGVDQLTYQYLLPEWPEWVARLQVLFIGLLVASASAFARDFLLTARYAPFAHRLLGGLGAVGLALMAAALLSSRVEGLGAGVTLVASVTLLATGAWAWRRGSPNGGFFVLAWLALLTAGTIGALTALGVIDAINLTDWGQRLGSSLEAILLSLGLADRINRLRREHETTRATLEQDRAERIESLNQLVAGVAHEIGNPLNLTLGGSRELKRRLEAEPVEVARLRPFVDLIVRGNERIERIVANLRAYTHSEPRPAERTDVCAAVEAALELLSTRLGEQRITVETDLEARPHINCRPGELDQVLANLLLNACQAMPEGGRIHVRCWIEAEEVRISIADSGPGVPDAERASIFRPFFSTGSGSGLGLSVSSQIARRNGGRIDLSRGGPGATFVVSLPVAPEAP